MSDLSHSKSEIKLVDVRLGERERLAEQDVVAGDFDRAQPAGGERGVARP